MASRRILAVFLCIEVLSVPEISGDEQREFDYFSLALTYPATYCTKIRRCCPSNGCCRQGSNGPPHFTIHGLWPDYNDGTSPSCCPGKEFDAKEVSSLSGSLSEYWPAYTCKMQANCYGGKGSFWEHEWEKHGTCATSVTGNEYNYFQTALDLYFKYNFTEILRAAGYVASNSEKYPLEGIKSAIKNTLNATPAFECSNEALEQLFLCFDKELKPQDCPVDADNESGRLIGKKTCPSDISLPEYASSNARNTRIQVPQFSSFSSI